MELKSLLLTIVAVVLIAILSAVFAKLSFRPRYYTDWGSRVLGMFLCILLGLMALSQTVHAIEKIAARGVRL